MALGMACPSQMMCAAASATLKFSAPAEGEKLASPRERIERGQIMGLSCGDSSVVFAP